MRVPLASGLGLSGSGRDPGWPALVLSSPPRPPPPPSLDQTGWSDGLRACGLGPGQPQNLPFLWVLRFLGAGHLCFPSGDGLGPARAYFFLPTCAAPTTVLSCEA